MIHLTEDELIRLSQIELDLKECSDRDLKMVDHLKECKECCENYVLMRTIYSVGSDFGRILLPDFFGWEEKAKNRSVFQTDEEAPKERGL